MRKRQPSSVRADGDWIQVVDAAYGSATDLQAWGDAVFATMGQVFSGDGAIAHMIRHSEDCRVTEIPFIATDIPSMRVGSGFFEEHGITHDTLRAFYYPRTIVETHGGLRARFDRSLRSVLDGFHARTGIVDAIGIVLHPEPGAAVVVQTVTEGEALRHPDERSRLTWLGLHLEAALRLRLRPQGLKAVLGPTGQLEHHEPGAPPKAVLDQAVEQLRAARRQRRAGGDALGLWRALVAGELSVVERPIGTRPHYHFFENPPHRQPFQVLSAGEQDAIAAICRAQTNKSAAYELGISEGALSLRLAAAASKLGLGTRMELVRIAAMLTRDPRARFEHIALTPSEEHVLELVGQGLSNDQIAKIRLRSTRTIANQVASLLKKTKSATRKALVVKAERFRHP